MLETFLFVLLHPATTTTVVIIAGIARAYKDFATAQYYKKASKTLRK